MEQYHKFSLLLMLNTLFNSAWDNFLSNENHPPYFLDGQAQANTRQPPSVGKLESQLN